MALQNEQNRLQSAWRALDGKNKGEGWQTIQIEPSGSRQLLAGRYFPGNKEAILIGFGAIRVPPDRQLPHGRGFRVERVTHKISGDTNVWISLSRQPGGSLDMFTQMAEDILGMLESCEHVHDQAFLHLFLGRIRAWQDFMHQAKVKVLGPEAEIGLAGELHFMKLILEENIPATTVLDGWQGPLDGRHDFVIGSGAIEVKSTVATRGFPALIGSLEQIDISLINTLFLAGIRFVLDDSGMTLPEIISNLSSRLDDCPEIRERFETLVLRAGFLWAFSDQYQRRFSHPDTRIMMVNKEFPALTRNNVDSAIRAARYELDLDLIPAPNIGLENVLMELGALA